MPKKVNLFSSIIDPFIDLLYKVEIIVPNAGDAGKVFDAAAFTVLLGKCRVSILVICFQMMIDGYLIPAVAHFQNMYLFLKQKNPAAEGMLQGMRRDATFFTHHVV